MTKALLWRRSRAISVTPRQSNLVLRDPCSELLPSQEGLRAHWLREESASDTHRHVGSLGEDFAIVGGVFLCAVLGFGDGDDIAVAYGSRWQIMLPCRKRLAEALHQFRNRGGQRIHFLFEFGGFWVTARGASGSRRDSLLAEPLLDLVRQVGLVACIAHLHEMMPHKIVRCLQAMQVRGVRLAGLLQFGVLHRQGLNLFRQRVDSFVRHIVALLIEFVSAICGFFGVAADLDAVFVRGCHDPRVYCGLLALRYSLGLIESRQGVSDVIGVVDWQLPGVRFFWIAHVCEMLGRKVFVADALGLGSLAEVAVLL